MSGQLSNKATFYDLFCYWISGFAFMGVLFLYWYAFYPDTCRLMSVWVESSKWSYFVVAVLGYVSGHLANALSSLVVEHWLFRGALLKIKNPFSKALRDAVSPDSVISHSAKTRARVMISSFEELFGYKPGEDSRRELRLIAQTYLGGIPPSGMNYMAYYGLNRVMFLLSFLSILPIATILVNCGATGLCVGFVVVLNVIATSVFLWQYWRFVGKYSDFLASLVLLVKLPKAV